jgi:protease-4
MSFIKNVLATITGIFIALILLFFIMIGIIASSASEPEPYIRKGTTLKINLSGMITERKTSDPFQEAFNPGASSNLSMDAFRSNLKKAAVDDRISGIWLDLSYVGGAWTQIAEIRSLLKDFKSSGKYIYSYIGDLGANEASYYLATVSDSIFAQPEAMLELDGFYIQGQFYKKAFEKFGLNADVVSSGTYKTAGDMYTNERFSATDREQLTEIMDQFSGGFVQAVSEYSGIQTDEVNAILNAVPSLLASNAYERGLLDGFKQPFEFEKFLQEKNETSKLHTVTFGRYNRVKAKTVGLTQPKGKEIAIVYAEGPIMPEIPGNIFSATEQNLTYQKLQKVLNDLEEDDNVAAVVIRVNSPGGAVTTSEIIRAHIAKLAQKKPVVASMGSIAASGGYYISMGADTVMAEPNTITGSIGVVFMKLSYSELMSEKLGITTDEIKSHKHANWFSPDVKFTNEQRRGLQQMVEITYDNFLQLVADARGMEVEQVHEVAQGRVWTGLAAKEVGLVDEIGTLSDAVKLAAEMAGVIDYKISTYPTPKTFFETLMESSQSEVKAFVSSILGLKPDTYQLIRELQNLSKPQIYSIIPIEISLN